MAYNIMSFSTNHSVLLRDSKLNPDYNLQKRNRK